MFQWIIFSTAMPQIGQATLAVKMRAIKNHNKHLLMMARSIRAA